MNLYRSILPGSVLLVALAGCKEAAPTGATPPPGLVAGPSTAADDVVATIDGVPIHRADIQSRVALRLYQLEADMYSLLSSEIDEIIERRLLDRAAAERGLSVAELLRVEVEDQVEPVTDADVEAYLAQDPRARAAAEGAHARVTHYLRERRVIERRLAYVQGLRDRASIAMHLTMPERPRVALDISDAPRRGPEQAPVTLIHFASFSSPGSLRSTAELAGLVRRHPDQIRWVHRHLVDIYDEVGLHAARLAVLAEEQGRFWDLHDRLFEREGPLTTETLTRVAAELQIEDDPGRTGEILGKLKVHFDAARIAGVERPPVLFVNGRYFSGTFPYEHLAAMVAEELEASKRGPTAGR